MKAKVRRTIEMSRRVLNFSQAHLDPSPGYAVALARLEKALAEADVVAARQQEGFNAARAATGLKRSGRRKILRTQMFHLTRVAESAEIEVPGITEKFRLPREGIPYLAFRTAARGMLAEALNHKELLIRHGLLESVLKSMADNLDKFEAAVEQGSDARRTHVGASAELDALADELNQVTRLMDGINRSRFSENADLLAEWESASNVIGPPRAAGQAVARSVRQVTANSDAPAPGGEIKPAA